MGLNKFLGSLLLAIFRSSLINYAIIRPLEVSKKYSVISKLGTPCLRQPMCDTPVNFTLFSLRIVLELLLFDDTKLAKHILFNIL